MMFACGCRHAIFLFFQVSLLVAVNLQPVNATRVQLEVPPQVLDANASWTPRSKACVVVIDDVLIMAGGFSGSNGIYLNDVYQLIGGYDWSLNVVDPAFPFPGRFNHVCAAFLDKIWLIGGSTQGHDFMNDIWMSDDYGVTWLSKGNGDFSPRQVPGLTVANNKMWLVGGTTDALDMWTSEDGIKWSEVKFKGTAIPAKRFVPAWHLMNGQLWLAGGFTNVALNDVWSYDMDTSKWTEHDNMPTTPFVTFGGHALFDNTIVVIGGQAGTQGGTSFGDPTRAAAQATNILQFDGTSWDVYPQDPMFPVAWPIVTNYRDTLFVMGGDTGLSQLFNEVYVSSDKYLTAPSTSSSSSGMPASSSTGSNSSTASTTAATSSTTSQPLSSTGSDSQSSTASPFSSTGDGGVGAVSSTGPPASESAVLPPPTGGQFVTSNPTDSTGSNAGDGSTGSGGGSVQTSTGSGSNLNQTIPNVLTTDTASNSGLTSSQKAGIIVPIILVAILACVLLLLYLRHIDKRKQSDSFREKHPDLESGQWINSAADKAMNAKRKQPLARTDNVSNAPAGAAGSETPVTQNMYENMPLIGAVGAAGAAGGAAAGVAGSSHESLNDPPTSTSEPSSVGGGAVAPSPGYSLLGSSTPAQPTSKENQMQSPGVTNMATNTVAEAPPHSKSSTTAASSVGTESNVALAAVAGAGLGAVVGAADSNSSESKERTVVPGESRSTVGTGVAESSSNSGTGSAYVGASRTSSATPVTTAAPIASNSAAIATPANGAATSNTSKVSSNPPASGVSTSNSSATSAEALSAEPTSANLTLIANPPPTSDSSLVTPLLVGGAAAMGTAAAAHASSSNSNDAQQEEPAQAVAEAARAPFPGSASIAPLRVDPSDGSSAEPIMVLPIHSSPSPVASDPHLLVTSSQADLTHPIDFGAESRDVIEYTMSTMTSIPNISQLSQLHGREKSLQYDFPQHENQPLEPAHILIAPATEVVKPVNSSGGSSFIQSEPYSAASSNSTPGSASLSGVSQTNSQPIYASNATSTAASASIGSSAAAASGPAVSNETPFPVRTNRYSSTASRVLSSFEIANSEVELLDQVGRGGFGTVYRGVFRGQHVAVKFIDAYSSRDVLDAFEHELVAMCSVHSNRLLQVYGACKDPVKPFLVVEWMERGSLHDCLHGEEVIKQMKATQARWSSDDIASQRYFVHPFSMRMRLQVSIQVLEGVTYMHNSRPPMLHGDIKAQNILVDESWNAKIADFGFARITAHSSSNSLASLRNSAMLGGASSNLSRSGPSSSQASVFGGTLAYLPPEHLAEEAIQPDSSLDMYATGVVLWQIFTASIPWANYSFAQILFQVGILKKTLPMLPIIPTQVQQLLQQLFAERSQRPSASVALQQLRKMRADELEHDLFTRGVKVAAL